jgi:hypothetical protein
MIAFDLAYELTLGAGCARYLPRGFRDGLLVSSLVYIPSCVVTVVAWPEWQLMGWRPSGESLGAGLVAGGSVVAHRLSRRLWSRQRRIHRAAPRDPPPPGRLVP